MYDLDETLAEVYPIFYFLMSLKIKNKVPKEEYEQNKVFFNKIDRVYYEFVKKVSEVERSKAPLGILRPGIIGVMRELEELRNTGKLKKVIIYSNNGDLENLEFVKDVIVDAIMPSNNEILAMTENNLQKSINSGVLIKNLIHLGHPGRVDEIPTYERNGRLIRIPSSAKKTWPVLEQIIKKDNTNATDFVVGNIFFFDDRNIKHDIEKVLKDRYYKVPAYEFRASAERLGSIYEEVVLELERDPQFNFDMFYKLIERYSLGPIPDNGRSTPLKRLVNYMKALTKGTSSVSTPPPPPDSGITMMMEAIGRVKASAGGKRRREDGKLKTRKRKMRRNRVKTRARKN